MSDFDKNPYAVTHLTDDYGWDETPVHVPDYFVASIVSAFFCLPFGIPAIIFATKANSLKSAGNVQAALEQSRTAKVFTFLALGLGAVVVLLQIIVQIVLVFGR